MRGTHLLEIALGGANECTKRKRAGDGTHSLESVERRTSEGAEGERASAKGTYGLESALRGTSEDTER